MRFLLYAIPLLVLFLNGCATLPPQTPAYSFEPPIKQLKYLADVEPVLVKRCVVCHSCYNSPCQLKLSSWDGLERGASKEKIYNGGRLKTMDPSRLLIDAHSVDEWRKKDFYSVTEGSSSDKFDDSIMYMLLDHKRTSPAVKGEYFSEASDLTCSENSVEVKKYLKEHPNNGMPFGFPPLLQDEFNTIVGWLSQGAPGPTKEQQAALVAIPAVDQKMIEKWELFLNNDDPKHRMTARYLYEHLFLAHITFKTGSNEFYELVRSKTAGGEEIDIIPTVRPYDDPEAEQFFYRFRKIYSTIVHKTHMVFPMDQKQLDRVGELFIDSKWSEKPHLMTYNTKVSANPFITFAQIPAKTRYQWLLDNNHYIIMTFIRGPVCKGQVALNVINDQFWLMFVDPDYDLTVKYPGFLKLHYDNLRMPGEKGSDYKLFKSLFKNEHYSLANNYYKARQQFYSAHYPEGMGLNSIWAGNRTDDSPMLTVFRHFDSATVLRGVHGKLPKTAWVVDYPLLERIYYALVAGFDIYGAAGHQLATRLYMDALRIEGESYFLDFMPAEKRKSMMAEWYLGSGAKDLTYYPASIPAKMNFTTSEPKRELLEEVVQNHLKVEGIAFDPNYLPAGNKYPELPTSYDTIDDIMNGFISVSAPGVSFFRHVADHSANVAWVRITNIPKKEDVVVSVVVNRWHDNVRFLFLESSFLDPSKDSADFVEGFVGSYPNYFFVVNYTDLPDFFTILNNYDGSEEYVLRLEKYGINRAEKDFWGHYDWFQAAFNREQGQNGGIVDLNRYYYRAIEK
ncbi:fatty acid cis/trans isomerase [Desulforhopalus sp. 52FAK]